MSSLDESSLMELCGPVFARVCEFRLGAEKYSATEAADAVLEALTQAETRARVYPELERNFELIRHDLYFFADHILARAFGNWRSLAAERLGIVAGDEIFCRDLEEFLEEPREYRGELEIFRTCLGLGFDGKDAVGVKRWQQNIQNLTRALPLHSPDSPATAERLVSNRRQGPARRRWWPIILFACLSLMLLALSAWQVVRAPTVYRRRLSRLRTAAGLERKSYGAWVDSPAAKER